MRIQFIMRPWETYFLAIDIVTIDASFAEKLDSEVQVRFPQKIPYAIVDVSNLS